MLINVEYQVLFYIPFWIERMKREKGFEFNMCDP